MAACAMTELLWLAQIMPEKVSIALLPDEYGEVVFSVGLPCSMELQRGASEALAVQALSIRPRKITREG